MAQEQKRKKTLKRVQEEAQETDAVLEDVLEQDAEERAAVEWLENLTPAQRLEHFRPVVAPLIERSDETRIGFVATLKDDHEGNRAHCVACKDPSTVVVA